MALLLHPEKMASYETPLTTLHEVSSKINISTQVYVMNADNLGGFYNAAGSSPPDASMYPRIYSVLSNHLY
jgi:hypothetical protein